MSDIQALINKYNRARGYKRQRPSRSIAARIERAFDSGDLKIGESEFKKWEGYQLKSEPWTEMCFSDAEMKGAREAGEEAEHYLESCAAENSERIAREEGWQGVVMIDPYDSGVPYGLSIFYKKGKGPPRSKIGSTIRVVSRK